MVADGSSSPRRAVLSIAAGTGAANLIVVAGSPVIAYLFTPSEFGTFSSIAAVAFILTPLLSLRLELAVPLAEDEVDSRTLVVVGCACALVVGAFVATALLTVTLVTGDALSPWAWTAPLIAAPMAVFQLLNALAIRAQRYSAIAIRNVTVGLATLVLQVALGASGLGISGLLLGWGLGQLAGAMSLLRKSGLNDAGARQSYTLRQGKAILRRFRHVPTVLAPAGAINVMGLQLPVILLAALYGPDVAGQFGLTQRVLTAPVALIGLAVAQVYLGRLAAVRRAGGEPPVRVFRDATRQLAVIGTGGAAVLLLFSEPLFLWVYGSSWATSGQMARMLSIALLFQIVASPLSQTLVVYGRHKTQLAWDSSRLIIVGSTVYFSSALDASPVQTVAGLSMATAATYAISWYLSWRTLSVAHAQWRQEQPPQQLS